ncbi:MAG TPA: RNA polymerase sigma factor [Polyangiales bacterium]|jgi:RNA polymerase sigma-70 factor (ECF subfamily)|nr:RNA polymerase sigma factor [Polyangiales bacterium]
MGTLVNFRPQVAPGTPGQPGDPAELDLIEACRRGERAALHTVFVTHSPYLERLLGRVVGPSLEVQDLLQSTFLAAIGAFPRFRGEAHVRTWLARIAVRIAHEKLRSASHKRRADVGDPGERSDDTVRSEHAEHDLDMRRRVARLHLHLDTIGPKKRIAFVLHVFEGHPIEEVAALTGASVTATKSRVFWARRELMKRASRDPLLSQWAARTNTKIGTREVEP